MNGSYKVYGEIRVQHDWYGNQENRMKDIINKSGFFYLKNDCIRAYEGTDPEGIEEAFHEMIRDMLKVTYSMILNGKLIIDYEDYDTEDAVKVMIPKKN
jgi:hypothetical protein